jgi:GNAT superfamily N-acetyltransferase
MSQSAPGRSADHCRTPGPVTEDLPRRGHENLIEHCRLSTLWGADGQLHEVGGVMLFSTGTSASMNATGAFRLDPAIDGRSVVERADDFFGSTGRDYFVKVRDTGEDDDLRAACQETGFISFGWEEPEMACTAPLADRALPANVTLQAVTTVGQVEEFIRVSGDAYANQGATAESVASAFSRPDSLLAGSELVTLVAYEGEQPMATGHLLVSHGVGGIYWVGTTQAARGRGFGTTISRALTNGAFERGAGACTLQATAMAEQMYRQIGYEELFRYTTYVRAWARKRRRRSR